MFKMIDISNGPAIHRVLEVKYRGKQFFYFLSILSAATIVSFTIRSADVSPKTDTRPSLFGVFPLMRQAFFHRGVTYLSAAIIFSLILTLRMGHS